MPKTNKPPVCRELHNLLTEVRHQLSAQHAQEIERQQKKNNNKSKNKNNKKNNNNNNINKRYNLRHQNNNNTNTNAKRKHPQNDTMHQTYNTNKLKKRKLMRRNHKDNNHNYNEKDAEETDQSNDSDNSFGGIESDDSEESEKESQPSEPSEESEHSEESEDNYSPVENQKQEKDEEDDTEEKDIRMRTKPRKYVKKGQNKTKTKTKNIKQVKQEPEPTLQERFGSDLLQQIKCVEEKIKTKWVQRKKNKHLPKHYTFVLECAQPLRQALKSLLSLLGDNKSWSSWRKCSNSCTAEHTVVLTEESKLKSKDTLAQAMDFWTKCAKIHIPIFLQYLYKHQPGTDLVFLGRTPVTDDKNITRRRSTRNRNTADGVSMCWSWDLKDIRACQGQNNILTPSTNSTTLDLVTESDSDKQTEIEIATEKYLLLQPTKRKQCPVKFRLQVHNEVANKIEWLRNHMDKELLQQLNQQLSDKNNDFPLLQNTNVYPFLNTQCEALMIEPYLSRMHTQCGTDEDESYWFTDDLIQVSLTMTITNQKLNWILYLPLQLTRKIYWYSKQNKNAASWAWPTKDIVKYRQRIGIKLHNTRVIMFVHGNKKSKATHWITQLFVYHIVDNQIEGNVKIDWFFADSKQQLSHVAKTRQQNLELFIKSLFEGINYTLEPPQKLNIVPKQKNNYDCGVYPASICHVLAEGKQGQFDSLPFDTKEIKINTKTVTKIRKQVSKKIQCIYQELVFDKDPSLSPEVSPSPTPTPITTQHTNVDTHIDTHIETHIDTDVGTDIGIDSETHIDTDIGTDIGTHVNTHMQVDTDVDVASCSENDNHNKHTEPSVVKNEVQEKQEEHNTLKQKEKEEEEETTKKKEEEEDDKAKEKEEDDRKKKEQEDDRKKKEQEEETTNNIDEDDTKKTKEEEVGGNKTPTE